MTRDELQRMAQLKGETKRLEQMKEELLESVTNISAFYSDMPKSRIHRDRMAEYMVRLEELDAGFIEAMEERANLYLRYTRALMSLKQNESAVLRLRYEDGKGWRKIANELSYSESHVQTIHRRVLKKIVNF